MHSDPPNIFNSHNKSCGSTSANAAKQFNMKCDQDQNKPQIRILSFLTFQLQKPNFVAGHIRSLDFKILIHQINLHKKYQSSFVNSIREIDVSIYGYTHLSPL